MMKAKFIAVFVALMLSSQSVNASKQVSNQESSVKKAVEVINETGDVAGSLDFYSGSSGTISVYFAPNAEIELSDWGNDNEERLYLNGTGLGVRFKAAFFYLDYYSIDIDSNDDAINRYSSISLGANIVPPLFYISERYVLYTRLSAGIGGAEVEFSESEGYMLIEAAAEIGLLFDKHYSVSLSAKMQGSLGTGGTVGTTSYQLEFGYMF